jgi:uncharacterized protein DUF6687
MRYVPWDDLHAEPNIIVDGYPAEGTLITLSHWVGSGSPDELADDLSTQIAFRYLDRPDLHVAAEAVSNNHFDEDGLSGIYTILHPAEALDRRAQIIDVASAGDFGVFDSRDAARVAFALMSYADEERSPLGGAVFDQSYTAQSGAIYEEGLAKFPEMLAYPAHFRALWEQEDSWLQRDLDRVGADEITIEELPDLDLAIVRLPEDGDAPIDSEADILGCHQGAIHNRTRMFRTLVIRGNRYIVRYRYETWVRYVSRPTMPRVDLAPLAADLSGRESGGAVWTFDGNDNLTPKLRVKGDAESSLSADDFIASATDFLRRAATP